MSEPCAPSRPLAACRSGLRAASLASLALCLFGCGFADAGDGTRSLSIQGTLRCSYPELLTRTTWTLADEAGPVVGASVTLVDADNQESIEVAAGPEPGQYVTLWPGYHRRVSARIWRGKDGARFGLEGPAPHLVLAPAPGTMLPANAPLEVKWQVPDGLRADRVDVHVDADGGEAGAPLMQTTGGSMAKDSGKARLAMDEVRAGPHALQVARTTRLVPAGAATGSEVQHTYAVDTAFYRSAAK